MPADTTAAAHHLRQALAALGFPDDVEMARTPEQVAEFLAELLPQAPPAVEPLPTASRDLVVVRDLPYHSLCAHHLLPFFGHCSIVYRPDGHIAGLGWFPRLLDSLARRPQLQERLAADLADGVLGALGAASVGVHLTARQLCVEMRGARSPGSFEVSARRGAADPALDLALARMGDAPG